MPKGGATVARRLSTLASFYKYCEQEQLVDGNPALNVRRPKVDYESRTLGLDRNELGALLVQAGLGSPRDHALASLLAVNGLRISEALGADIGDLDFDRGHRTQGRQCCPSRTPLPREVLPFSRLHEVAAASAANYLCVGCNNAVGDERCVPPFRLRQRRPALFRPELLSATSARRATRPRPQRISTGDP